MKLLIFVSFIQIAWAAPELRSAKALKTSFQANSFSANLNPGFHFNDKAPNGIQLQEKFIKPNTFLPRTIKFENLQKDITSGMAYLYVCDDKVTFCDMHSISLGSKGIFSKPKIKTQSNRKINLHGFILDDFDTALKNAKNENKIILANFGARWCPACVRLENEILTDKKFKNLTKSYVKIKVDIDQFSSFVIKDKYNVKGVPTILFLTPAGKEITRFYDFQPMSFINEVINEIKNYPEAIEELETKELTPEIKIRLAKRYFFSDQHSKAIALMETMNPFPREYWFAKVAEAESLYKKDPSNKKYQIQTLIKAIESNPESSQSLVWRMNLVSVLDKNSKEIKIRAQESEILTQKLLNDETALKSAISTDFIGEYTDLEGFYIAMINAETSELADLNSKKSWENVITQGEKYKINAHTPGASLRLLTAMIKAENFEKALNLVNGLLQTKNQDGDLLRRKMRILFELKKYEEAIQTGENALKNSYGINEFFVVETLAKAYVSSNKKDHAKKLISRYLNRNEINFSDLKTIKGKLENLSQTL